MSLDLYNIMASYIGQIATHGIQQISFDDQYWRLLLYNGKFYPLLKHVVTGEFEVVINRDHAPTQPSAGGQPGQSKSEILASKLEEVVKQEGWDMKSSVITLDHGRGL